MSTSRAVLAQHRLGAAGRRVPHACTDERTCACPHDEADKVAARRPSTTPSPRARREHWHARGAEGDVERHRPSRPLRRSSRAASVTTKVCRVMGTAPTGTEIHAPAAISAAMSAAATMSRTRGAVRKIRAGSSSGQLRKLAWHWRFTVAVGTGPVKTCADCYAGARSVTSPAISPGPAESGQQQPPAWSIPITVPLAFSRPPCR